MRQDRQISQESMAKALNISPQQYQKYETAQDRIAYDRLVEIAKHWKITVSDIIAPIDKGTPDPGLIDRATPNAKELLTAFARMTPKHRRLFLNLMKAYARK